jgi:hypothetical protein
MGEAVIGHLVTLAQVVLILWCLTKHRQTTIDAAASLPREQFIVIGRRLTLLWIATMSIPFGIALLTQLYLGSLTP